MHSKLAASTKSALDSTIRAYADSVAALLQSELQLGTSSDCKAPKANDTSRGPIMIQKCMPERSLLRALTEPIEVPPASAFSKGASD